YGDRHRHKGRPPAVQAGNAGRVQVNYRKQGKRQSRQGVAEKCRGAQAAGHIARYVAEPPYQWHAALPQGGRQHVLPQGRHQENGGGRRQQWGNGRNCPSTHSVRSLSGLAVTGVCCPRTLGWWRHYSTTTIAATRTTISTPAVGSSCASHGYALSPPTISAYRNSWPTATWSTVPHGIRPRAAGSGSTSTGREG